MIVLLRHSRDETGKCVVENCHKNHDYETQKKFESKKCVFFKILILTSVMIIPVFGVMRQVQRKVDLETKEKRIRRALIEREVLVACAHPFVCNLYTAFQVRTYIGGCQEA